MNNKPYIIYKISSKVSGKSYIGLTCQTLEQRFVKHLADARKYLKGVSRPRAFMNAILKYGEDGFDKEIIAKCKGLEAANKLEMKYIKEFDTFKKGYNCTKGGDGVKGVTWADNPERVARAKEAMKEIWASKSPEEWFSNDETKAKQAKIKFENPVNAIKVVLDNIEYKSIREAARQLNTTLFHVKKKLESPEHKMKPRQNKSKFKFRVDGLEFETREAMAEHFGMSVHCISSFLTRHGKTWERFKDVTEVSKKVERPEKVVSKEVFNYDDEINRLIRIFS